jgi:cytochrome P450
MPASSSQLPTPPSAAEPDPLGNLLRLIEEQGDVVQFRSHYGPVYLFNHPDQVQAVLQNSSFERSALLKMVTGDGLLASDGRHWQSQRRLLQPPFHEKCLHGLVPMVVDATMGMLRRWESSSASGQTIDIGRETKRLTLEIILRMLFEDVTLDQVARMADAANVVMQYLGELSDVVVSVPLVIDPGRESRFRAALGVMNGLVAELTASMRPGSGGTRGVVPTLLEAREKGSITDQDVRNEIVTMIIAGHETTAIALAWALHLLAQHPEVQARLTEEVDQVLRSRVPTSEDLFQLSYMRMVIDEAMRLYPPVSLVVRQSEKAEAVGGVPVPQGALVILSAYTTHRHPRFWEDPERFDPERFHPDRSRGRHRFAYFPFLGGRHQCLGQGLVMLEAPAILAMLTRHVRIALPAGSVGRPLPGMALRVPGGFPATVEFRKVLPSC